MKFKLLQLQGSNYLHIDNLYMFYMPVCSPAPYWNVVTIAMNTSRGSRAGSKIENSNMPYELYLLSTRAAYTTEAIPYPSDSLSLIWKLSKREKKRQLAWVYFKPLLH